MTYTLTLTIDLDPYLDPLVWGRGSRSGEGQGCWSRSGRGQAKVQGQGLGRGQGRGGVKPRFWVKGGGEVKVVCQGRGQGWGRVRSRSGESKEGVMVGGSRGWSQGGSRV